MYGELYGEIIKIQNIDDYINVPDMIFFQDEQKTGNISMLTLNNEFYRRVLSTSDNHQIVLMSLNKGQEIGEEMHPDTDQFIRIEKGNGVAILNGKKFDLRIDSFINIPKGTVHNIINTGKTPLKLYTIYSPPHHRSIEGNPRKGLVQPIKK